MQTEFQESLKDNGGPSSSSRNVPDPWEDESRRMETEGVGIRDTPNLMGDEQMRTTHVGDESCEHRGGGGGREEE